MLNKFRNLKKFKKLLTDNGYYVGNKFQNGEVNLIKKVIKKFDLFIDCGFHVGDISLSVRKISQEIKIIGFDFNKNFDYNHDYWTKHLPNNVALNFCNDRI